VLPRIVCLCDEYYALISGDRRGRKETEIQISLLGAKARAAGIHLILATQQPSREVIKGALDANMPARIGFLMVKGEESRMLLGQTGAENLAGKGDLLFRDVGDPVRLQAPLVSDAHPFF
jgi:DNA segregation ATPase FtsK/SpoIIIE-like protein